MGTSKSTRSWVRMLTASKRVIVCWRWVSVLTASKRVIVCWRWVGMCWGWVNVLTARSGVDVVTSRVAVCATSTRVVCHVNRPRKINSRRGAETTSVWVSCTRTLLNNRSVWVTVPGNGGHTKRCVAVWGSGVTSRSGSRCLPSGYRNITALRYLTRRSRRTNVTTLDDLPC